MTSDEARDLRSEIVNMRLAHDKELESMFKAYKQESAEMLANIYTLMQTVSQQPAPATIPPTTMVVHTPSQLSETTTLTSLSETPLKSLSTISRSSQHHTPPYTKVASTPDTGRIAKLKKTKASTSPASSTLQPTDPSTIQPSYQSSLQSARQQSTNQYSIFTEADDDESIVSDDPSLRMDLSQVNLVDPLKEVATPTPPITQPPNNGSVGSEHSL